MRIYNIKSEVGEGGGGGGGNTQDAPQSGGHKASFIRGGELAQWLSTRPLIQRSPVRFQARSHTGVMDYDEAYFMHLTPGVVHNFLQAVGV